MSAPTYLTSAERGAYSAGFDRAARAYLRKHGSPGMAAAVAGEWSAEDSRKLRAHSASWHATHDATRASKCHAGGMSAARKLHRDIVTRSATYAALEITDPAHAAELARQADAAAARLAELDTLEGVKVRKPARKAPARKLASVPDVVDAPAAVETVPAAEVDNSPAAVESRRRMFAGLGWATSPAPSSAADRPEADAVARLRRTSKLVPCDRHASYWQTLTPARRFATAVEGGTATPCDDGPGCILTPGTDRYAAALVSGGPIRVDALNSPAPAPDHGITREDLAEAGIPGGHVVRVHIVDDVPAAPETVPAPMPAMSYAARKASRRELAATMRAAGIRPDGLAWQLARAGVDLADIPAILSGDSAVPEGVNA